MLTLMNTVMLHMYFTFVNFLLVLTALQINSLIPRPPPSFLLLTVRKNRGIIYHMSYVWV